MSRIIRYLKSAAPVAALSLFFTAPASASTGGSGLPWEGPLSTIQSSLTGPVATAIAVIALFAAGAALVFGDEMSNFVKRVLIGVMALALLIAGSHFLSGIGLSGFTI